MKAASGVKKADNVIDGIRAIDKVSDANKLSNGEKWFNYFNKAYGAENVEWTSKIFEGKAGLRKRVFANIEMSRLARESSGFSKDIDVFHLQYKYNMINNPGPLSNFRGNPASNFLGGRYNSKILEEDTILYPSGKSGGLTIPGKEQNALGQWFTMGGENCNQIFISEPWKIRGVEPIKEIPLH